MAEPHHPEVIPSLHPHLLDKSHHCDFSRLRNDNVSYNRGGYPYRPPYGWTRYALHVNGKYQDHTWLTGSQKRKAICDSAVNEWPVSYHGTSLSSAICIAATGYDLSRGVRFQFGIGIYSSPNVDVALIYAKEKFQSSDEYWAIVQNRVNPRALRVVCEGYWLVPTAEDIRPYAICLKKV